MIREKEGSKGIRLFIAFLFIAVFFFIIGFIADRWFFAKDGAKKAATVTEKEAAFRKFDSDKKGDDTKNRNPIVGEEKEDFTFYKSLQNGKEPLPLKQQKTDKIAHKPEVRSQKSEGKSQQTEKTENSEQKKEEKAEKTEVRSQEIGLKNKKSVNAKEKSVKRDIKDEQPAKEKRFTLQIAAFKEREKAEDIAGSLKKKGYEPYIVPVTIPAKGIWYRVRIGRFATRPDAQNLQAKLKNSEGISAFITFTTE